MPPCPRSPPGTPRLPVLAAVFALALAFLLLAPAPDARAQVFGKNKIHYADFEWRVMRTPHIDLHFYPEEEELAEWVARVAEDAAVEIMCEMDFDPETYPKRIPFILYSTHHDFQQSNISPGIIPEEVGGLTDLIKGRVLVPHTGSYHRLQWVVRHELVHAIMLEKLSQTLREHKKTRYGYPPLWYVEGLAEFLSTDWDARADMVIRDAVLNDYLADIQDLWQINGTFQMYKQGQSILMYVEKHFGREKVLEFLSMWWKTGNFDTLVPEVLGITVEELNRGWTEEIKKHYFPQVRERDAVEEAATLLVEDGSFNLKPCAVPAAAGSSAGSSGADSAALAASSAPPRGHRFGSLELVHLSSFGGFPGLRLSRYEPGRAPEDGPPPELLVKGGTSEDFESLHFFESALDVNARREVLFVAKAGERDVLHIVDVDSGRLVETLSFPELVGLSSPSWSPDGQSLVVSGVGGKGHRDLYRVARDGTGLTALTQDCYDDRDPDWAPGGEALVFASDRCPEGPQGAYNLYLLDLGSGEMKPLTTGNVSDAEPAFSPDGERIVFRSDRDAGTYDLFLVDRAGTITPLPRFQTAALDPEWTPDGRSLLFTSFVNRRFAIFGTEIPAAALEEAPEEVEPRPAILASLDPALAPVSIAAVPGTEGPSPEPVSDAPGLPPSWIPANAPLEPAPPPAATAVPDTTWKPALPDSSYPVTGYERHFGLDIVQGGVAFDPDFGGGGGGQLAFSDLLGNEQLYVTIANEGSGGGQSFLQAFDLGVTYMNQSRRLNWGVGGFRLSRTYNADLDVYRYETRLGGLLLASYPLTRFNRLETSLVVRHISDHLYRAGVIQDTWFISNLFSYIHDTTLWSMVGPFDGTRYNITVGLTTDIGAGIGDYTSLLGDYRRYFRLPGGVIYAFRGSARMSFGQEGQRHFAGGAHTLRGYGRRSVYGTALDDDEP